MSTHECPEPTCTQQVPFGHLACKNHWFMVPNSLRRELMRAWNGGSPGAHYMETRQACIDFLTNREPRP